MIDMDTYIGMGIISVMLAGVMVLWSLTMSVKASVKKRKDEFITTALNALAYADSVIAQNARTGKYDNDETTDRMNEDHQRAREIYWIRYG